MQPEDSGHMSVVRRVALVTGAAQGLGLAIAERLAQEGVALVLGDRQHEQASEAARNLAALGVECVALPLDVSSEESVANTYRALLQHFGRLDILVNNAGISGMRAPLEEMPLSDWEMTLRINLTGTFLMSRGAVPIMKRQRWGRIVNISSQAARSRTGVGKCNYAASKAGMLGFARVLADEVGRSGITVNSVCPSRTVTPLTLANASGNREYFEQGAAQTALGRLAEPQDTAAAVAFLCSDEASFLTGAVIDVTGGAFMP
jgi:3-oxoacyl-[acyl-carrier protein] reductase